MPWRVAAASNFRRLNGLPTRRAAISVSAVWRWQKLDPSASNASVPSSGTDDRTRDSRARRSKTNAENPTAQRTAETAHSAPAGRGWSRHKSGEPRGRRTEPPRRSEGRSAGGPQYVRRIPSVELRRAARGAEAPQEQSERDRPLSKVGSPPKHPRADVAGPDRDRQRDKWSDLNKEIERMRRAFAFGYRLLAEASDTLFNLAGGVLNRAHRNPFMCSIRLATSRFTASRSSRNSSRSESAFSDAVMIAKPLIVARHPLR